MADQPSDVLEPDEESDGESLASRYAGKTLPVSIDSSRPYPEGPDPHAGAGRRNYLGGLAWTREAEGYFGPMVPGGVAYAKLLRTEWWRDPYLLRRVGAELGKRGLEALLLWRREGVHYWHVQQRYRMCHRPHWLENLDRRARRVARRAIPEFIPVDWDEDGQPRTGRTE